MVSTAGISSASYRPAGSGASTTTGASVCSTSVAGATTERTASETTPIRPRMLRRVLGEVRRWITAVPSSCGWWSCQALGWRYELRLGAVCVSAGEATHLVALTLTKLLAMGNLVNMNEAKLRN